MRVGYEVAIRGHGSPIVRRGPCEGLPDWPRSVWTKITTRPIGLARATALADKQACHAVVCVWQTSETVYDNGKEPYLPNGWLEERRPANVEHSDMGGLPKLPAICSQCGEPFSDRACGPTHAIIWQSIEAPVREAQVAHVGQEGR